jgi:two-component system chemotaxis response regulator CheB
MRQIDAVVIGASVGGVEGLSVLLPALPATLQAPIFIVMHLPSERRSLLSQIFASKCALRVDEAEDKAPVGAGCVYFAPPGYHLLLDEGPRMALSVDEPVHYSRPSIDVLFASASDLYRQQLLGIILTGASQDGADGLAAVREGGGVTVVQQPDGTYESHMATAALKRGPVDYVLPLEGIAGLIRSLPMIDLR